KLCLSVDAVLDTVDAGEEAIMVAMETGPADEPGMRWSAGIVTAHGGLASHAAIYSRGLGLPAVCGVTDLMVQESSITIRSTVIEEGDIISIDGATGELFKGGIEISAAERPEELDTLLRWCDEVRTGSLGVRANADTAEEAAESAKSGADGIGLCRTEHMFLGDRLPAIRKVLTAEDENLQRTALNELRDIQKQDFINVLEPMGSKPVTVRLLDAPLHEFLENNEEQNPMLGLRGVRLALGIEGLYRTQTQALIAAVEQRIEDGQTPMVEIMVPLIAIEKELEVILKWIGEEIQQSPIPIPLGTMIETPRGALIAGQLAPHVDFISFGTNDLTQMTFGFSRDDVEASVISEYIKKGVLEESPFSTLDQIGVGELVRIAIERSKEANPTIKIGICGEHGGDPKSIRFLSDIGVDYVSCSPPRLPIARLIGAQQSIL
ncbi:MAG: putative PEP-binding protein, partial [Actinomycetota bacterium]